MQIPYDKFQTTVAEGTYKLALFTRDRERETNSERERGGEERKEGERGQSEREGKSI